VNAQGTPAEARGSCDFDERVDGQVVRLAEPLAQQRLVDALRR